MTDDEATARIREYLKHNGQEATPEVLAHLRADPTAEEIVALSDSVADSANIPLLVVMKQFSPGRYAAYRQAFVDILAMLPE